MTKEQNDKLMDAINNLMHSKECQDLKNLVMELSLSEHCNKGCYLNINPDVKRNIDWIGELCGWIHDTLNKDPKTKNGKTYKIRKALGYTYP